MLNIATKGIVFVMVMQFLMCPAWSNQKSFRKTKGPFAFSERQKNFRANFFPLYFEKFDQEDQKNFPGKDSLLCIGSSSMLKWRKTIARDLAPLKVTPRGFGGSVMPDVLAFKDFFLRYKADRIMIYEGDNDLWGSHTPNQFVKNCKEFVKYIHKHNPSTKIYFISVKPSISRKAKWDKCLRGNALLKAYTKTSNKLFYIDIASALLNKDGSVRDDVFVKDNLHLNAKGYTIWTKAVRKALGLKPLKDH